MRKGDILVSGIVENLSSTTFVNSKGTITAFSIRDISVTEKYKQKIFIKTDKIKKRNVLELFTLKIPLYLGKIKSSSIDTYTSENVKLLGECLPIVKYKKTSQITKAINKEYSREELLKIIDKKLDEKINDLNLKIIDKREKSVEYTEHGITISQRIIVEENIAKNQPILINSIN